MVKWSESSTELFSNSINCFLQFSEFRLRSGSFWASLRWKIHETAGTVANQSRTKINRSGIGFGSFSSARGESQKRRLDYRSMLAQISFAWDVTGGEPDCCNIETGEIKIMESRRERQTRTSETVSRKFNHKIIAAGFVSPLQASLPVSSYARSLRNLCHC